MESLSPARKRPPGPPHKALDATRKPSTACGVRVIMEDERGSTSPEYIEISSSSSSFDNSEDENLEELDHLMNPLVQQQFSSEADSRRQPLSSSTPDQMADPAVPPAQPAFDNTAREPSATGFLGQHNLSVGNPEASANNSKFNNFDDLDIQDVNLTRLMEEQFRAEIAARNRDDDNQPLSGYQLDEQPLTGIDPKAECLSQVQAIFPDICIQHISVLYATVSNQAAVLVPHILAGVDGGTPYPKSVDTKRRQKRKRELDEDEEAAREYSAADRPANTDSAAQRSIRTMLAVEFPETPMVFIEACLRQNGYRMFLAYRIIEEAERTFSIENPPYNRIKTKRKMPVEYQHDNLENVINSAPENDDKYSMFREFQAARKIRKNAEAKREEERQIEHAEQANMEKARADGTVLECQCCFDEYPMNRMVNCDNEKSSHLFCKGCAKQNAETVIGQSKYELVCMAMDGCKSSFSKRQQDQFLDEKTLIALERNLLEANLRMAGIEDLASCPFCPNAAQYPPIEVDKEFRCDAEDCGKISCRLCKLETHIPKSCEEHAKDMGLSIRRQIEEAMSEALIRKCNKCGTPFVKEEGCNKMTCTRPGCGNVQCYVCSKSCVYSHFNDESRGGKTGNCPLFEKTSQRHENEVKKAEKDALKRIRIEHPEIAEEDLSVRVSEAVLKDEQRRHAREAVPPRNHNQPFRVVPMHIPRPQNMVNANYGGAGERYEQWHNPRLGPRPLNLMEHLLGRMDAEAGSLGNVAGGGDGAPVRQNSFHGIPVAPPNRIFAGLPPPLVVGAPMHQPLIPGAMANASPAHHIANPSPEFHHRVNRHYPQNAHAFARRDVHIPDHPAQQNPAFRPVVNDQGRQADQLSNSIVQDHGDIHNARNAPELPVMEDVERIDETPAAANRYLQSW